MVISHFSLQHFRFHLEPKGTLQMPAHNKGSTLRPRPELSRTAHLEGQWDTGRVALTVRIIMAILMAITAREEKYEVR